MSEQIQVSADVQLMINNLIAHSRHVDSPFPMRAINARTNVEKVKRELLAYISKLEKSK